MPAVKTKMNPFLNRNKVTEPAEFFGRKRELDYIIKNITYKEPQSVAVIGERRSGKSSLLTRIYQIFSKRKCDVWKEYEDKLIEPEKFVCIMIDPEEINTSSSKEFTWILIDEIISEKPELAEFVEYYPKALDKKEAHQRHPQIILKNLLRDACEKKYRFVFLFDEFELLARNLAHEDVKFLHYLRGISDNYALAYVTSSRKPLSQISRETDSDGSPFDNNFSTPLYLGLLQENGCEQLIVGTLKFHGEDADYFSAKQRREAIDIAGRHPYFLKIACANLFDWVSNGNEPEVLWTKKYRVEADEEFDRMWSSLGKKERDWLITSQRTDGINREKMDIHEELESLYLRGILKDDDKNEGALMLFSESFTNYVREYINALADKYERIEQGICKSYVKLDYENVKKITNTLGSLVEDWHEQRQDDSEIELGDIYLKCDRLHKILSVLRDLLSYCDSNTENYRAAKNGGAIEREIDNYVKKLCGYFEGNDWFGEQKKQIKIETGKIILDRSILSLEKTQKKMKFGNGFDRLLAVRVEYMKKFGDEKFPDFEELTKNAFDRLVEVHDYSRATSVLQLHFGCCKNLAGRFFRHPAVTVFFIVVIPLFIAAFFTGEISEAGTPGKILRTIITFVVAAFFAGLAWMMFRAVFSEKYCDLPDSRKLYKKLLINNTLLMVPFFAIISVAIANIDKVVSFIVDVGNNEFYDDLIILGIAAGIGVFCSFIIAIFIKGKVLDFATALKRARYFCCIEYFKSFVIILLLYIRVAIFTGLFTDLSFTFRDNLTEITNKDSTWHNINLLYVWKIPINLSLIIGMAFIGPVTGACSFVAKALSNKN